MFEKTFALVIAAHEMASLNGGAPLDAAAFENAKRQVIETILRGVAAA